MRVLPALLLAFAACTASAQELKNFPCKYSDKACAFQKAKSHSSRQVASMQAMRGKPVAERIGPAPAGLVEFLHLDNIVQGFPDRPSAARMDEAFVADIKAAFAGLPPRILAAIDANFFGLYLVDDLGGTGYTDVVLDGEKPVGGYIVLDAKILASRTANAWATWKENTPFKPGVGPTLKARIEEDGNDTRANAIQYILLHELGHVFAIGRDFHPIWTQSVKDLPANARFPFLELSWRIDRAGDRIESLFDQELPQRRNVVYYFGPKLTASDMAPTYTNLEKTNYVSLYAATRVGDDFAESFASYVHGVLLKKPWSITISLGSSVLKTYGSCWEEKRCEAKRRILEAALQ